MTNYQEAYEKLKRAVELIEEEQETGSLSDLEKAIASAVTIANQCPDEVSEKEYSRGRDRINRSAGRNNVSGIPPKRH